MAPTQADSVDEELMTQLDADLSGEIRKPEVHVLSEGSSGSDTESIEANGPGQERHQTKIAFEVELFRNRTCFVAPRGPCC